MSLIDCPECTHDVSEHAESCPHCGYPFQQSDTDAEAGVVLTDIDIGFNSWALILLKAGIAGVPVAILVSLLYIILSALLAGGMLAG